MGSIERGRQREEETLRRLFHWGHARCLATAECKSNLRDACGSCPKKKNKKKLLTRRVGGKTHKKSTKKCQSNLRDAYKENVSGIPQKHMPSRQEVPLPQQQPHYQSLFPGQRQVFRACSPSMSDLPAKRERERELNKNVSQIAGKHTQVRQSLRP